MRCPPEDGTREAAVRPVVVVVGSPIRLDATPFRLGVTLFRLQEERAGGRYMQLDALSS
ncbi:hypothetical protein ACX9R5_16975 [Rathayibacter sp. CAU 1779]